jgi:hypothetical protein
MRALKARERGDLPPLPLCNECGKKLKLSASSSNKAAVLGLCHDCWRRTSGYKEERARQNAALKSRQHKAKVWPVAYYGARPGEEYVRYNSARRAHSACYVGKGKTQGALIVCWSDGLVVGYWGRTAASLSGLKPSDGDVVIAEPSDFYNQLTDRERSAIGL